MYVFGYIHVAVLTSPVKCMPFFPHAMAVVTLAKAESALIALPDSCHGFVSQRSWAVTANLYSATHSLVAMIDAPSCISDCRMILVQKYNF